RTRKSRWVNSRLWTKGAEELPPATRSDYTGSVPLVRRQGSSLARSLMLSKRIAIRPASDFPCLALAGSRHQLVNRVSRWLSLMQDGVHLLGDRHFDTVSVGQSHGSVRGEHPFGNHAVHTRDDFRQLAATTKLDAETAVARETTCAGEHQVAQSSQSCHGLLLSTTGYCEPRDFSKTTSN